MARHLIQSATTGDARIVGDAALAFFPGYAVVDTYDDGIPPAVFYGAGESDLRYVNVTELSDPASAASVTLRATSVAAVEDAPTVGPTGAWDFAQAPTVGGVPVGSGGGGAVASVNGQTGVVVLDADDIGDGSGKVTMTTAERTKLGGVASGATANATDAQLRDRTTHTGAQAISTVTGLQTALDAKAALTGLEGIKVHDGTTGGGTRPTGFARVRWVGGTVRPTNMAVGDVWEHDA